MSALLGCSVIVLVGCGSMPVTGDVKAVDASQPGDSQVQVYAVEPREGAAPSEIVDGFLESMTSDDPGFRTTRKYLSEEAAKTWQPGEGTTVLAQAPNRSGPLLHDEERRDTETSYTLTGEKVAAVDAQSSYQPLAPTDYSQMLHLVREKGADGKAEWRIDIVPDGLVLGQSDFKRLYRSVNKYYFATGGTNGQPTLVADPVYVRTGTDPVTRMSTATQTVRTLLEGPTNWLRPVVDSRFPAGTALRKDNVVALAPDDQNVLKVRLNDKADKAGREACRMMAAQVFFTLRDLTSARVEQVELEGGRGRLCALDADEAAKFSSDNGSDGPDSQYFIDAKGRVQRIAGATGGNGTPEAVQGPLGAGTVVMGAVGVARDEQRAAAVSATGQHLYVASLVAEGELAAPVVTSAGKKAADRLSSPSWDGRGDLWVADRDPERPRLLRLVEGEGEPQEVRVPGLGGGRIEELRLSADGVRIALLVTENGHTTLKIGRVERRGTDEAPEISVEDLRQAAPQLTDVTAISWSGRSRLVVVGKEAGGVQQVRYVQADGSTPSSGASGVLPGVNQVQAVAAADDELLPLMAETEGDGIVKLSPGDNWQTVQEEGTSLVYPG
ncbi:LpqB family beta-propeller domain-containing protein [Streptomyces sp. NPDC007346]|uniref:LpqB family beta-propeller domain-containing protein n=1 Tax=Streptomyces sp. NPDC007346 TaxID=3154682 RepID=UPI003456CF9B